MYLNASEDEHKDLPNLAPRAFAVIHVCSLMSQATGRHASRAQKAPKTSDVLHGAGAELVM